MLKMIETMSKNKIRYSGIFFLLIGFIIILMIKFKKISNLSFILMIPYLLWCIYALTLNTSLYILN